MAAETSTQAAWVRAMAELFLKPQLREQAAAYLGFVERRRKGFALTSLGSQLATMTRPQRIRVLAERIAGLPVFREALTQLVAGVPLNDAELSQLVQGRSGVNVITANRRAKTVQSWIAWLRTEADRSRP